MRESGHRFTYTEDPHSGQVRTLSVDGVRWLSPREAALQAQATADRARADEREKAAQRIETLMLDPKDHCIEEYNAGLTNAASAARGEFDE